MKTKIILIFSLTIIFYSCQKYGKGYVRGTVTDTANGAPAEGLTVYVIEEIKQAKGQSYYSTDTVGSAVTGSDGTYKINFQKHYGWAYSYKIALGKNDKYVILDYGRDLYRKKTVVSFNVYEKAYAKIKITKTTTKPTSINIQIGGFGMSGVTLSNLPQNITFTDSLIQYVFTVPGNYLSKACVKAEYLNDHFKLDYCSAEKYIQVGDTALFSVTYD